MKRALTALLILGFSSQGHSQIGEVCWGDTTKAKVKSCAGSARNDKVPQFCEDGESTTSCFFRQPLSETHVVNSQQGGLSKELSHIQHLMPSKINEFQHLIVRDLGVAWNRAMRTADRVLVPFSVAVRWSGKGVANKLEQGTLYTKGTMVLRPLAGGAVGPDPETLHISEVSDSQKVETLSRSLFFSASVFGNRVREEETLKFVNRVVSLVLIDRIAKNPRIMASPEDAPEFIQVRMPRPVPQRISGL